jgi:hypothetical protein
VSIFFRCDLFAADDVHSSDLIVMDCKNSSPSIQSCSSSARLKHQYQWNFIGFLVLGVLNNMSYCVVMSAAQSLCLGLEYSDLTSLVIYTNICLGMVMLCFNSICGSFLSYPVRFGMIAVGQVIGIAGVIISTELSTVSRPIRFVILLSGVGMIGASSAFGETVTLGYLERFPAELVGAWATGTGLAGVVGGVLYGGLRMLGWPNSVVFAALIGLTAVYVAAYVGCIREPQRLTEAPDSDSEASSLRPDRPPPSVTFARLQRVSGHIWWLGFQLLLVYAFEYACQGAAAYVQPVQELVRPDCVVCRHFYPLALLAYQVGVGISRASLAYAPIQRVEVLTVLQGLNMIGWLAAARTLAFGKPPFLFVLFPWMLFIGLLGGASYVNTYFLIRTHPDILAEDRALAMNLGVCCAYLGLNGGTLLVVALSLTLLSRPT